MLAKYLHHLNFGSVAHAACRSLNNSERLFSLCRKIILDENIERLWKGLGKKNLKANPWFSRCSGETETTRGTSAVLLLSSFYTFAKGSGRVEATSSPVQTRTRHVRAAGGKVLADDPNCGPFWSFHLEGHLTPRRWAQLSSFDSLPRSISLANWRQAVCEVGPNGASPRFP